MRVLDGVIAVFCAVGGVQPQSETVWRQADRYSVPRMVFVNKMDRTGADFLKVNKQIKDRLKANALPIQLPIGAEGDLTGIIDLVANKAYLYKNDLGTDIEEAPIPSEMEEEAAEWRNKLMESVAENDEDLIEISSNSKIELIKTAYHLGNRHVEVEIEEDILLTKCDYVIENMLKNFNVDILNTQKKFFPERGAHSHE